MHIYNERGSGGRKRERDTIVTCFSKSKVELRGDSLGATAQHCFVPLKLVLGSASGYPSDVLVLSMRVVFSPPGYHSRTPIPPHHHPHCTRPTSDLAGVQVPVDEGVG